MSQQPSASNQATTPRGYRPGTAADAFVRLVQGENPWVAIGDFLDDWRRTAPEARRALVVTPLQGEVPADFQRWAAFFAAMVEELCQQAHLAPPDWTARAEYQLETPWYLHKGRQPEWRAWQEETSPPSFRKRKIYGGDNILARA